MSAPLRRTIAACALAGSLLVATTTSGQARAEQTWFVEATGGVRVQSLYGLPLTGPLVHVAVGQSEPHRSGRLDLLGAASFGWGKTRAGIPFVHWTLGGEGRLRWDWFALEAGPRLGYLHLRRRYSDYRPALTFGFTGAASFFLPFGEDHDLHLELRGHADVLLGVEERSGDDRVGLGPVLPGASAGIGFRW